MTQSEVKQLEGKIKQLESELHRSRKELAFYKNGNEEERKLWEATSTSQKLLDHVLSQMPLVLWSIDCESQITLFQGAGLEQLGLGKKSYHGQPLLNVLGEDPALASAIQRAFSGETFKENFSVRGCSLTCHFEPQENAEQDVVGVRGVALVQEALSAPAITKAETNAATQTSPEMKVVPPPEMSVNRSRQCEAPLLEWLTNFPDYVLSVDRDGTIRFINHTIAPLTFETVVGTSIFDFIREDRREEIRASMAHAFATGECVNYEIESNDPDGVVRTYECRLGPFKHDGQVVSVIVIARDVTELRRMEDLARKRQADLAHLSRVATMGEMAAIMAHYLNNPLAAISNYAHGCIRRLGAGDVDISRLTDAQKEIVDECNRCSAYIRRLRGFLQKRDVQYIEADLTDILLDAIRLTEPEFRDQDLTVHIDYKERRPRVYGDALQIEQVLVNLLLNAADAMRPLQHDKTPPSKGREQEIVVRVEEDSSGVLAISVIDFGHGLTPEFEEKIFEPFFTTQQKRLGMGLSVSRSIIESHGGRLEVTNNDGPGATVRFTLPRFTAGQLHD